MPRYEPLNLGSSNSPNTGPSSSSSSSSRSAFYCSNCCSSLASLLQGISIKAPSRIAVVGYTAGLLFAVGWWIFIDGAVYASTRDSPPVKAPLAVEDFVPGILSTFALIIVNLINKETLSADDFSFSGTNVAGKARACAFVGVTMALSALIGALTILSIKYVVPGLSGDDLYFGVTIAIQNFFIFISSMILWFGRNHGSSDVYGF